MKKNKTIQEQLTVLIEDYTKQLLVQDWVIKQTSGAKELHQLLEQATSNTEGAESAINNKQKIDNSYWGSLDIFETLERIVPDSVFKGYTPEQVPEIEKWITSLREHLQQLYVTLTAQQQTAQKSHDTTDCILRKNPDLFQKQHWSHHFNNGATTVRAIQTSKDDITACQKALTQLTDHFKSEPPASLGLRFL